MRMKNKRRMKKALKNAGISLPAIVSTTVNSSGNGGYNATIDRFPDASCVMRLLINGGADLCAPWDLPGVDQVLVCNTDDCLR